tara:strand:- start:505 stop:2196 length:1692 start_codon:yes stop_codon:yes gene_type:complete
MFKKILSILDFKYKMKIFYLLLLYLPLNLIETFSISSIPGFIILISEPQTLKNFFPHSTYIENLINFDIYKRSIIGASILVIIFLLRSLFIIFVNWYDYSIRFQINILNSKKLFSSYLFKPYLFHINNSSSSLIQNMGDSLRSTSAIFAFLNIIKDLILLALITITIFYASPNNFIYLFIFTIVPMFVLFFLIKNIVKNLGSLARNNRLFSHKSMSESFLNIKFLKIQNLYDQVLNDYISKHKIAQKNETKLLIINTFPRLILEFLSLIFIILFITFNIKNYGSLTEIIPIVTLIVVASVRLIPSFNQISINLSNLKFNQSTISKINSEITQIHEESQKFYEKSIGLIKEFNERIEVKKISFDYNVNKRILKNISFDIEKNEKVAIIGASGTGKTTLSDIILGLLKPSDGVIKSDGTNIHDDIIGWRTQLSYVPQNIILFDGTIRENICFNFNEQKFNNEDYKASLRISGLDKIIEDLPNKDDTDVGYLSSKISGGQKQRIGIARAIYFNKPIMILDESTNSLDKNSEDEILSNLFKEKKTIIFISHNKKIQDMCDKRINLDD